jgi:putative transposase
MAARERHEEAGAAHHVFPRGNNRQNVFRDDGDRQVFLVTLKGVAEVYGWRVLAFCLMGNHVHLVIQTPLANLGEGMQRLLGTYGKFFNWRYLRSGHVFRRPFKSERIKDERQLAVTIAYVAENPVRAGLCLSAEEWRWSSHCRTDDAWSAGLRRSVTMMGAAGSI